MGCGQPVCIHGIAGWLHHERMDKRRSRHDRLLQRRYETGYFKIERIDIPENDDEREWLEKQNFRNTAENAYTG